MIVRVFRRVEDAKELLGQWIGAFASEDPDVIDNNNKFLERFKCDDEDSASGCMKTKLVALDMLKDLRILDIDVLKNRTILLLHKVRQPFGAASDHTLPVT